MCNHRASGILIVDDGQRDDSNRTAAPIPLSHYEGWTMAPNWDINPEITITSWMAARRCKPTA